MKYNYFKYTFLFTLFSILTTFNLYAQDSKIYGTLLTSQHIKADSLKSFYALDIVQKNARTSSVQIVTDQVTQMEYVVIIARRNQDKVEIKNYSPQFSDSTLYQFASISQGNLILIKNIKFKIKDSNWILLDDISLFIKE